MNNENTSENVMKLTYVSVMIDEWNLISCIFSSAECWTEQRKKQDKWKQQVLMIQNYETEAKTNKRR